MARDNDVTMTSPRMVVLIPGTWLQNEGLAFLFSGRAESPLDPNPRLLPVRRITPRQLHEKVPDGEQRILGVMREAWAIAEASVRRVRPSFREKLREVNAELTELLVEGEATGVAVASSKAREGPDVHPASNDEQVGAALHVLGMSSVEGLGPGYLRLLRQLGLPGLYPDPRPEKEARLLLMQVLARKLQGARLVLWRHRNQFAPALLCPDIATARYVNLVMGRPKLCGCGCGRPVPSGRTKYFDDRCMDRQAHRKFRQKPKPARAR